MLDVSYPRSQSRQSYLRIRIHIKDAVLGLHMLYKGKPLANYIWIFVFGPLVVVSTRMTRTEL